MQLIENIPLGIALVDANGYITHANRCLRDWFRTMAVNNRGRAPAGGVPARACIACGESCHALCDELRSRAAGAGGMPFRRRFDAGNGLLLEVRCETLPEEPGFLLVVEDVTARQAEESQRERALQDANARLAELLAERSRELVYSREFLRSLIETNRDLVFSVDEMGIITFANQGFVGATAGSLIGKALGDLVEERFREKFVRQYRDVLSGHVDHILFEASGYGTLGDRWCLFSAGPVRRGTEVSGLTVIVSDLTSLNDAWERLRGSEKLVATGRMAARIAHEINNPLTGISGAMQLIKADLPAGSQASVYANMVDREILRISKIVRQMYGLYRPEQESSVEIDLAPLIDDVVTLMRVDAVRHSVQLISRVVSPEPAFVQEQNLHQILMNIIRNALEVTRPGGVVEVSIERHGRCVDVVVTDQGPGVTEELRQQMFEPFYTTKSSSGGHGLGLGLSISDSLVKAMGGSIEFEGVPAGGARCKICLPESGRHGTVH